MTTDIAAGYISGLIDGEGWVAEQKPERGRTLYRVCISNTDMEIIDRACSALTLLGVRHYVNSQQRGDGLKRIYHVLITHKDGLIRLHQLVTLCSRKQAALDEQIRRYMRT